MFSTYKIIGSNDGDLIELRLIERIHNIGDAIFKSNFQSTHHKCVEEGHPTNGLHLRNFFL